MAAEIEGQANPAGQLVQAMAEPTLYVPAAQAVIVAVLLVDGHANPAGQAVQSIADADE
jgi:hypothetical protein